MTAARHDWIAVGPYGAYALLDAQFATKGEIAAFKGQATRQDHTTELITVAEAVRRHHEYLDRCDRIRAAAAAEVVPASTPSSAQFDLFATP